ncbi:hypothetical protein DPEC_G00245720 [Dallia pectoralis]|uniref:Uncharacterized protein n=1 Tax=Dallia pectoralis TaxID=75939 RepID=A0ACC2FW37_DALPE|nr:hypothetical protein DPEC_G00245720 [Dallia pectoralis]
MRVSLIFAIFETVQSAPITHNSSPRMVCELLLSSLWFLFVIFWVETISVWLFLCIFYQDRTFYHWGDGAFADDPGQMLYMLSRADPSVQMQT